MRAVWQIEGLRAQLAHHAHMDFSRASARRVPADFALLGTETTNPRAVEVFKYLLIRYAGTGEPPFVCRNKRMGFDLSRKSLLAAAYRALEVFSEIGDCSL